jgi:hypothetical protein
MQVSDSVHPERFTLILTDTPTTQASTLQEEHMSRIALAVTAAIAVTTLSLGGANATSLVPGEVLGGLNLTGYCQAVHGTGFKAVALGDGAGDWVCQRSEHDRRPISVQRACEMQYKARPVKAVTIGSTSAGSWRCSKSR